MQEQFYTYMYLRQKDGTPYYIGKGCGDRARSNNRTILKPDADARIYIQYWADEAEAFEMERWYITLFGRKDLGTGILRNMTDGGEGASGMSPATRAKLSAAKKADPAAIEQCRRLGQAKRGQRLSEEHCRKMSEANKGKVLTPEVRKKISDATTGRRLSEEHCRKIGEIHSSPWCKSGFWNEKDCGMHRDHS